jgi:hypothetical protein
MGLWGIDSWRFRKQCGEQPSSGGYVVSWVLHFVFGECMELHVGNECLVCKFLDPVCLVCGF